VERSYWDEGATAVAAATRADSRGAVPEPRVLATIPATARWSLGETKPPRVIRLLRAGYGFMLAPGLFQPSHCSTLTSVGCRAMYSFV
jgi:hypothetical protein